jgi:tRNA A-37 threonylcarbamoyl transferase component Bud32
LTIKNYKIHSKFLLKEKILKDCIINFKTKGSPFGNQDRNSIKLFDLEGKTINIKSFKVPNLINQIAYKFFRKSKAQRSFEYANKLTRLNIGTPQPIAYYEFETTLLFKNSFYISEHLNCDLTYRELTTNFNYPDHESILRAFTRFTFNLHENGIHFLDHSPGNTLIKKTKAGYRFYLVDLNRMEFKDLGFEERIRNFSRLTAHKSLVEIMSDEYSKCINVNFDRVFSLMWGFTQEFQRKYWRKQRIKQKLKFWKK